MRAKTAVDRAPVSSIRFGGGVDWYYICNGPVLQIYIYIYI